MVSAQLGSHARRREILANCPLDLARLRAERSAPDRMDPDINPKLGRGRARRAQPLRSPCSPQTSLISSFDKTRVAARRSPLENEHADELHERDPITPSSGGSLRAQNRIRGRNRTPTARSAAQWAALYRFNRMPMVGRRRRRQSQHAARATASTTHELQEHDRRKTHTNDALQRRRRRHDLCSERDVDHPTRQTRSVQHAASEPALDQGERLFRQRLAWPRRPSSTEQPAAETELALPS